MRKCLFVCAPLAMAARLGRAMATLACALLLGVSGAAPAEAESSYRDPSVSGADLMHFDDDDAEMNAAMLEARATLDVFVALVEAHPEAYPLIKVRLALPEGGDIYKWMLMADWGGGAPHGVFVADSPSLGVSAGDEYHARSDEIADWAVILPPLESGPIYGDFTTRVMIGREPNGRNQSLSKRHRPTPMLDGALK